MPSSARQVEELRGGVLVCDGSTEPRAIASGYSAGNRHRPARYRSRFCTKLQIGDYQLGGNDSPASGCNRNLDRAGPSRENFPIGLGFGRGGVRRPDRAPFSGIVAVYFDANTISLSRARDIEHETIA